MQSPWVMGKGERLFWRTAAALFVLTAFAGAALAQKWGLLATLSVTFALLVRLVRPQVSVRVFKLAGCSLGAIGLFSATWATQYLHGLLASYGNLTYAAWWTAGLAYTAWSAHHKSDWLEPSWKDNSDGKFIVKMIIRSLVWPFYLGGLLGYELARWVMTESSLGDAQPEQQASAQ